MQQKNNPLHQVQARVHQPSAEEEAKRLRRQRRFEEDAAQFRAENVSTPMQQMHLVKYIRRGIRFRVFVANRVFFYYLGWG